MSIPTDVPAQTASRDAATVHMAIGPTEPIGEALRRLACEQLSITKAAFSPPDDEAALHMLVHQGRKAAKRTRALLRLVRDSLGDETYRNENAVVRDQARRLSDLRIASVLVSTTDQLAVAEAASLPSHVLHDLRRDLLARRAEMAAGFRADADGRAAARTAIGAICARITAWRGPLDALDPGSVPAQLATLVPGVVRAYKRGRGAMNAALEGNTVEAFHEWRKQVNYLRYQLEALTIHLPATMAGLGPLLGEISETLGADHDLADLARVLAGQAQLLPDATDRAVMFAAIEMRRRPLRRAARRGGMDAFDLPPREFVAALDEHWGSSA